MHPAVYIPIGVPLQFARTYNLETMGKKKRRGIFMQVQGSSSYSVTNKQFLRTTGNLADFENLPKGSESIIHEQGRKAEMR